MELVDLHYLFEPMAEASTLSPHRRPRRTAAYPRCSTLRYLCSLQTLCSPPACGPCNKTRVITNGVRLLALR